MSKKWLAKDHKIQLANLVIDSPKRPAFSRCFALRNEATAIHSRKRVRENGIARPVAVSGKGLRKRGNTTADER
ncbi:hypothetical protein [Burkholderia alba]|uniref:hypothetical protein n=1 Tax=Burkholderia alba TaxID=2683677 RepID=UPI002B05C061|nr:hypothetical protein [Burkholderia alba]